ncbi:uncharacterized protein LOC132896481 isoform X2 [Neoarius graeffei]|uniref:uncharacterized protein LOC132896481 isoform X2 n=1 Tax=Neoarius graeffei TaxID=443677 RepID=UPI00298CF5BB|nr:uncharacterized protein LOC132896481 isoform X2 [Neoarius graeffei]
MWRCGNCDALSVSELKVVRGAERTREVQQSPPARGFMSVTYRIRVGGVQDSAGVNEESYQARGTAVWPHPHCHIPLPPNSGRGAVWPEADPPPTGQEVRHHHLCPRPVDHLELKWLEGEIPTGDPHIGILHAVEPLEGCVVQTETERVPQQVIWAHASRSHVRKLRSFIPVCEKKIICIRILCKSHLKFKQNPSNNCDFSR